MLRNLDAQELCTRPNDILLESSEARSVGCNWTRNIKVHGHSGLVAQVQSVPSICMGNQVLGPTRALGCQPSMRVLRFLGTWMLGHSRGGPSHTKDVEATQMLEVSWIVSHYILGCSGLLGNSSVSGDVNARGLRYSGGGSDHTSSIDKT